MSTVYVFEGKEYYSVYGLRQAMPHISLPVTPTDAVLEALGVEIKTVADPEPEPITLDEAKVQQKNTIAAARYAAETSGIVYETVEIATDRDSQSLLSAAVLQTLFDEKYSVKWKTKVGFIELGAAMLQAVATAVRQHVQDCFNKEAEYVDKIDAAKTVAKVQGIVWE